MNKKWIEMVLRVAVAGEFFGHGVFAIQGKAQWIGWTQKLLEVDQATATQLMYGVGWLDVIIAFIILLRPMPIVLLWAALWGFWTAILRPIMGDPIWDFIERWANWGAPLALLLFYGWPKKGKEWWVPKA